jgi:hypothetical protein
VKPGWIRMSWVVDSVALFFGGNCGFGYKTIKPTTIKITNNKPGIRKDEGVIIL